MMSQFRNSNVGYYLYTVVVILIGAASIFVFWFMISGFNLGNYAENTFVGSVYVGGLTEQEAEIKVRQKIDSWLIDERVVFDVNYQGYTYTFNRALIFFDIDQSLSNIEDGRTNQLFVSYDESVRSQILFEIQQMPFMATLQDQFNLDILLNDLLRDAARMRTFSSKQLNDYIINEDNLFVTLNDASLTAPASINVPVLYDKLLNKYPNGIIMISPKSTFSMLNQFDATFSNAELSYLSTLILDLISESHMNLHERHYLPQIDATYTIDNYPYFGRNVRVHRTQQLDFSFENNGFCRFRITFDQVGNGLLLTLVGAPFLSEVEVEREFIYFEPPIEYTTNPALVRDGTDGVIVFVKRHIYNIDGDKIDEVIILIEYYPPVSEVRQS